MAKWITKGKRSRKAANALGLTKAGYLAYKGGTALALAERSPSGIAKQAAKLTAAAYAPAKEQLAQQEQRALSMQAKRDADNAAFAQWVQTRNDQLQAAGIAQRGEISQRLQQGQQEFTQQLTNIRDSANAQIQRQGGNHTSGLGGALGDHLAATQSAGQAATLASAGRAQAHVAQSGQHLDATLANNAAVVAAKRTEDFLASLKELEGVADDKQRLALAEAGDRAKTISQMLGEEITKAQAVIAAGQFGVKEQNDLAVEGAKLADKKADRKGDRADKNAEINKYGYPNGQWKKFSQSHRNRIIKQWQKDGSKDKSKDGPATGQPGSPQYKKAHNKAINQLNEAVSLGKGEIAPPPGSNNKPAPKRPKVGRGNIQEMMNWLTVIGFAPAVARMATLKMVYPKLKVNAKTAPHTYNQWTTYIKSLVGSR